MSSRLSGPATAVLLRDATRASRRWQTYAVRTAFTALLVMGVLLALYTAVGLTTSGFWDVADLAWLGRGLFVAFTVSQLLLATLLAPLITASGVVEETDERTVDLLVLTRLTPRRVLTGLVLARLLVLLAVVGGALPIMAMVVNLGGVSAVEVVSVSVHTLTTVVILGLMGALFALYTRSPMLATGVSALWVVPAYGLLPAAYAIVVGSLSVGVRFSAFLGPAAQDWGALLMPLSFAPTLWLIWRLATDAFALRVAGAHTSRLFDAELWGNQRWAVHLVVLLGTGMVGLPLLMVASYSVTAWDKAPWVVRALVQAPIWAWFVWAAWVGTWAWMRVGVEVVDALDRLVGRSRELSARRVVKVWSNPVAWREARPRAWGETALPILTTWAIVLLTITQSLWWLIPGGLLAVGVLNGVAAVALAAWIGTHSIANERRQGTLALLLTTRMGVGGILFGKLLGVSVASAPMLGIAAPAIVLGAPHAGLLMAAVSGWPVLELLARGLAGWLWLVGVWLATALLGMIVGLRVEKPQTAFNATLGLVLFVVGAPALAGLVVQDVPVLGSLTRALVPPLLGGGWIAHLLGSGLLGVVCLALAVVLATRLRVWAVGALLLALPLLHAPGAVAAEVHQNDDLVMSVEPLADGLFRANTWTSVRVVLRNDGRATEGRLSLVDRGGTDRNVQWERVVELPKGARKEVRLRFRPSDGRDRQLTFVTRDRRSVGGTLNLRRVPDSGVLIAVLGEDHLGLTGLRQTWGDAVPGRFPRELEDRPVRVGVVPPATAPDHSAAWGSYDWIVWPEADPERLDAAHLTALKHAVADGGHLFLTVTDGWRRLAESPVADMLPVELTGVETVEGDPRAALGLAPSPGRAQSIALATGRPRDVDGRTIWTRAWLEDRPLWVSGTYGLGTVHVLLVHPSHPALRSQGEAFWRHMLALPAGSGERTGWDAQLLDWMHATERHGTCVMKQGPHEIASPEGWESAIRRRLGDIPGVAPLPLTWLLLFSGLYLLVIGPVDYLVLRALGRQPLTWVTFPITVMVFSALALVGTSYTKGSQAVLTRVEVLDVLPGTGLWRGNVLLGVFATRKTHLTLENGHSDAVIAPLSTPGFMNDPVVHSTDGPTRLHYDAETWTLAYARSEWIAEGGGGASLRGERVRSDLPFALTRAWIVRHNSWAEVGRLEPGGEAGIRESGPSHPDLDFLRKQLGDMVEHGRGHLHVGHRATLVGIVEGPIEPLSLTGLEPVQQSLSVVRVPLDIVE